MISQVSVVIPVLNGAAFLPFCLDALAGHGLVQEVIVVDGGSADDSMAVARSRGAVVLRAPAGRGGQIRVGATVAKADFVLLLHADTVLGPGWAAAVAGFAGQAGYFRFRLDSPRQAARVLEWIVARRCGWFGLPYGDQGLLIAVDLLRAIGGVPDLPLMEDVALARRIGRQRLVLLPSDAVTSAARYERDGFLRRPLRNALCLALYFCGVPARFIRRLYD